MKHPVTRRLYIQVGDKLASVLKLVDVPSSSETSSHHEMISHCHLPSNPADLIPSLLLQPNWPDWCALGFIPFIASSLCGSLATVIKTGPILHVQCIIRTP